MGEEELNAENEEDLWAAAAEDLAQQKEMLRKAGDKQPQEDEKAAEEKKPPAPAPVKAAPPAPKPSKEPPSEVDRILDIPLQVTVELGRAKMLINDLLQLGQGSVIELTKLVGEPLEILVNERLVGKGEVVVVNEKFGIRLTEISTPTERIESMG